MKKVYFAGSIRGGRQDAALYGEMIAFLEERGCRVLTEHVGDANLSEPFTEEQIYLRDTAWLSRADLVIAECSCPSLGVGYELAWAEAHGKPCHILFNEGRGRLSAMLAGNPFFHIYPYEREEELYPVLDGILRGT